MLGVMSLADALQSAYQSTVRDGFLLERAERIASSYPASGHDRMRELFSIGMRRMNAAADLSDNQPVVAPILYREAAVAFIGAILASRGEAELGASDAAHAFERLDQLDPPIEGAPRDYDEGRRLLTSRDPFVFDRLGDDVRAKLATVAAVATWLQDSIEPRGVKHIRRLRIVRLALLGACALGLLAWGVALLVSPKNIALHKPFAQSSVHPNSSAPEGGLTDGSTSAYGVHTNLEANAWVRVDLQDVYQLKKIKIYNRRDGYFDEGLPFTLELSENGVDFTPVDRKLPPFESSSPWVYVANGKKARFIQVRGAPGRYVALAEIEAYGSK
jgi:hypothetical protein